MTKSFGTVIVSDALFATEPERALESLLTVYRATFDPRVALLISRLGATLGSELRGLPVKQGERGAALAERASAASAGELTPLLTAFRLFIQSAQGRSVWPAVEALAARPPDPRIASMALDLLLERGFNFTAKLFRRLVRCVEHHGCSVHARVRELARLTTTPARLLNVASKLENPERHRPLTAAGDVDRLDRLEQLIPAPLTPVLVAPDVPESSLISAICDAPADDAPRLMYADWLSERHQPRGEFIVLQVARAHARATPDARAREAELLQSHRQQFLGPFAGRVTASTAKFERGFLSRCALSGELPRHPLVRLLGDIEFGAASKVPRELRFDCLRVARHLPIELLPELMQQAPLLDRAQTHLYTRTAAKWTMTRELLRQAPHGLRHFEFTLREQVALGFVFKEAFELPALRALEALALVYSGPLTVSPDVFERLPSSLRTVTIDFHTSAWSFVMQLKRDAAGRWSSAEIHGTGLDANEPWRLLDALRCERVVVKAFAHQARLFDEVLRVYPSLSSVLSLT